MESRAQAVPTWLTGPAVLAPAIAAAIAAASVFTRSIGVPKANTLWAEDGEIFLTCLSRGDAPWACASEAYGGYVHVVPRLAANAAWLTPPDRWAVAVTVAAAAILAVTAWLVAAAVLEATGSWPTAIAGGSALGLVHQAGREVAGNLANAHWILFTGAAVLLALAWVGREVRRRDLMFVTLAGLSSPLAPLLAAIAALGWLRRRPVGHAAVLATLGASGLQLVASLRFPRDPPLHEPLGLADAFVAFVERILVAGPFGELPGSAGAGVAIAAAVVSLVLGRAARAEPGSPSPGARGALETMGLLVGVGLVTYVAAVLANRWIGPRYEYVPSVLLIEALVVGAAALPAVQAGHRVAGRLAPVSIVVAVLAVGAALSYRLEARTSTGPAYDVELEAARDACDGGATGSVRVRIAPWPSPWPFAVEVPCDRLPTGDG